jgi:hypothetical protein
MVVSIHNNKMDCELTPTDLELNQEYYLQSYSRSDFMIIPNKYSDKYNGMYTLLAKFENIFGLITYNFVNIENTEHTELCLVYNTLLFHPRQNVLIEYKIFKIQVNEYVLK